MKHRKRGKLYAQSVRYSFTQPLSLPANEAFEWCTDYQPYDLAMMKEEGKRGIRRITNDTILLTESLLKKGKIMRKDKAGEIEPAGALMDEHSHLWPEPPFTVPIQNLARGKE